MIKGKIFQKSIFSRLIITFLIIFIPIYLLSVGIHEWGMSIIRTEIINSMKSQMNYHKIVFQNEFSRIQNLQNECLEDEDLLKLANIPQSLTDFEKSQAMNRLQSRLYTLKNSSIYLEDSEVIIPVLQRTISANNGVSAISDRESGIISSFSNGNISKLVKEDNELVSRIRNLSLDIKKTSPRFVLQIKFSNTMLKNTITSFNIYKGSGFVLFCPDQDYLLSTSGNSPVISKIESNVKGNVPEESNYMEYLKSEHTRYITFYQKLNYNNIWLIAYIPEEEVFSPLSSYMYILWVLTVISVVIIIYFSFATHKFLQRPLKKLVGAFKKVEAGELKFSIQHNANDEFKYLYSRFNAMLDYVNNLIDQVYTQKIMSQKAELKQLQSQINPHFLFNSFFIMQRMIQGDDKENAIKFCNFLGQYFRYVTRNAQDEMPLSKEVEHARNYMEIQAIRFSRTSIQVEELPDKYQNLMVPRLILQPVIENSFEHGLSKMVNNPVIAIRFTEADDGLYVIIEDNGSNVDEEELQKLNRTLADESTKDEESTGLININLRVKLKFGNRSGLSVSRGELGGWKVIIFFEVRGEIDV